MLPMSMMILRIDEVEEVFFDLIPVPQDDGPDPVCAIEYPTSFRLAHDYLRACFKSGEKSDRSLKLSATCLQLNPANYTVWHYRRACMDALGYFDSWKVAKQRIQQDLSLSSQLGGNNPKNYQVWYHRRALLEAFDKLATQDATFPSTLETLESEFLESELEYLAGVLNHDSKNYHAWSHRQWLIRTVNQPAVWDQDLQYSKSITTERTLSVSRRRGKVFAQDKLVADRSVYNFVLRVVADYTPKTSSHTSQQPLR
jgi:protein farnesyltransferase/geranylgeranyltransferase type-1 subunit alpha